METKKGKFTKTQNFADFVENNGLAFEVISGKDGGSEGRFVALKEASTGLRVDTAVISNRIETVTRDHQVSWLEDENGRGVWMIHPEGESNRAVLQTGFGA
jgi:hypothetical protein